MSAHLGDLRSNATHQPISSSHSASSLKMSINWERSEFHVADLTTAVTVRHLGGLFTIWVVYRILRALYNISPLHPLYQFPGPRLAAMTLAYEAWYDLIKRGRYTREIQKMHEKYGESTSN